MKSPTLQDVAQLAGVSYATADRVLNQRGKVAAKSATKVQNAMAQLGYVRNVAAANLSRSRTQKIAFLIPRRTHAFFARMHAHLDKTIDHLKHAQVTIDVIEVDAFRPDALRTILSNVIDKAYDGLAIVGLQDAGLIAPLEQIRATGTKIVSLVSDLPNGCRDQYIGINNDKAGRSAARLMGMAHAGLKGQVVVAAGSLDALDHADRLQGFRAVLSRDFPNITLTTLIETQDDPATLHGKLKTATASAGPITGIYNVGAGNEGLVDWLADFDRPRPFCCILHELVDPARQALARGLVDVIIDQRPEIELTRALAYLRASIDDLPPPPAPDLIPAIYLRDNLPDPSFDP
ncbi:LacI family DNA-binding transcriptional regulator [Algirhabdus cladophorae]|uniref:LacI family DNA-binding transcriptional regulator n=1 Tax=Algirhabdus cladophorae TaxID=3377108 RepID=UPI003B84B011